MRRARNQKTRKSVSKRFKITGSGKIMRNRQGKRHLLAGKNAKRRRRLGQSTQLADADKARTLESLPFDR